MKKPSGAANTQGPRAPAALWGWTGAAGGQGDDKNLPTPGPGLRMTQWTGGRTHWTCASPPLPCQPLRWENQTATNTRLPSSAFLSMFGSPSCNSHLFHQDVCWSQSPFKPDHPYQRDPRYPIFHPQYPRRAKEHADALHKATIRDPLMEMDYNLQMIKTQLTAVGRYSRLCKGAVQMRSYQDLRCPKHLSILG